MPVSTPSITRIVSAPIPDDATQYMVPMRDGIRLATDVYLSGSTQQLPIVLIRLPYDKDGQYCFIPEIARYFTEHGYHVAAQDVRGKFRSEGNPMLWVNEVADSYDTIDWLTKQPYSNGSVAMWGDSYYGFTQLAAAAGAHPALKAIVPRLTGTTMGSPRRIDPTTQTGDVEMAVTYMYPLTHFLHQDSYEWDIDWDQRPFINQIEEAVSQIGYRSDTFDLWYPAEVQLPRFPRGSAFNSPPVPMLHTIGWWDNLAPYAWRDHREIQANHPGWQRMEHLLIESIDHENNVLGENRGTFERSADEIQSLLPAMIDPAIEFFDVYVKGLGKASDIPKVRYNIAHTQGLRQAESWPPAGIVKRRLYAHPDGTLTSSCVVSEPVAATWIHDPDQPVPSYTADAFAYLLELPDEAPRAQRPDVLTFTAHPVDHDTVLAGPVSVEATAASSGPKMDLHVWLLDIAPDGTGTRIARGNLHLADTSDNLDDAVTHTIDCFEVGYLLRAGHNLQLHIASSDAPEFLVAPGDGSHPLAVTQTVTNEQQVQLGGPGGLAVSFHILPDAQKG